MKTVLLIVVLLCTIGLTTKAQLATIKDPDGFVNVRANARIVGQFHEGDIFSYGEEKNGWIEVNHAPADSPGKHMIDGYIYKDRLLPIDSLPKIHEIVKIWISTMFIFNATPLGIDFKLKPFDPSKHILLKNAEGSIQKIDGKYPFGIDEEMPKEQLDSCKFFYGHQLLNVPGTAWNDLYNPDFRKFCIVSNDKTGFIYVHMQGSDGAGAYDLVWIFKNGKYQRRYIDTSFD